MQELLDEDPQRIGAYRLLGRLGAGGMGLVYLARSDRGRMVAVKLVKPELASHQEFRERFRQEVRAARRVGGRWTAPVLDADTEAPRPWVATGYVAGPSLHSLIAEHGPLPEASVRTLAAGLAAALTDIHGAGLVHRDLKPSNILVTIDGPRVIDFGIARALQTVTDGGLTRTGALVGSPGYMAPEQVRGERITPACDVFCLGSVLAHAATGGLPFGTADSGVHALMYRIAQEEPDLSGLAGLSAPLRELIGDCLRKDPALRPAPEQIAERVGADARPGAGGGREPWLPGEVVAELGQHAVRLLDRENPDGPTVTHQGGPAPSGPAHGAPEPYGAPEHGRPAHGDPAHGGPVHGAPAPGTPAHAGSAPEQPAPEQPAPDAARAASSPARDGAGPDAPDSAAPGSAAPGSDAVEAEPAPDEPGSHVPRSVSEAPATLVQPGQAAPPTTPGGPAGTPPQSGLPGFPGASGLPGSPGPSGQPGLPPPPPSGSAPYGGIGLPAPGAPGAEPVPPPVPHQPAPGSTAQQPPVPRQAVPGQYTAPPAIPGQHAVPPAAPGQPVAPRSPGEPGAGPPPPVTAAPRATTTPGHLPPYAPAYVPQDSSRRPWRTPLLAAAAALVVAVGGGSAVYLLTQDGSESRQSQQPPAGDNPWGDDSASPDTGTGPGPDGSTSPGTPTDGATDGSTEVTGEDGAIPESYLGTWEVAFGASGSDVRRFTLVQGDTGDTVFRMDADGAGYHCEFSAVLNSAGPPVELGPSTVDVGEPMSSCRPGPVTTLERTADGRLIRIFTDGSGEPLTYTKVG